MIIDTRTDQVIQSDKKRKHGKSKGKYLTAVCNMKGVKRKWLGLEPDFMLRRRAKL